MSLPPIGKAVAHNGFGERFRSEGVMGFGCFGEFIVEEA